MGDATVTADGAKKLDRPFGSFAGMPLFLDLALVSQARDGFVGPCRRSSTHILRDMIVYGSVMEKSSMSYRQSLDAGNGNGVISDMEIGSTSFSVTGDDDDTDASLFPSSDITLIEDDLLKRTEKELPVCCLGYWTPSPKEVEAKKRKEEEEAAKKKAKDVEDRKSNESKGSTANKVKGQNIENPKQLQQQPKGVSQQPKDAKQPPKEVKQPPPKQVKQPPPKKVQQPQPKK